MFFRWPVHLTEKKTPDLSKNRKDIMFRYHVPYSFIPSVQQIVLFADLGNDDLGILKMFALEVVGQRISELVDRIIPITFGNKWKILRYFFSAIKFQMS